jgi:DNA-binding transcriptional regulator GbsR (MarR family)
MVGVRMKEKEKQIIEHYGVIPQLKYMQTEMFEFIEAVIEREIHWNFDTEIQDIKPLDKHIEEEYADLTMMLEQIKVYYNLNEESIQKIKEQKIERQLERIKVSK